VTHEYLDVPGGVEEFRGVWYKDHATGANRVDKFERDIRLLTEALKQEPENHPYRFYLAQSYRDAGRTAEAVEAYAKRAALGGLGGGGLVCASRVGAGLATARLSGTLWSLMLPAKCR
jgi:hypothetical protein